MTLEPLVFLGKPSQFSLHLVELTLRVFKGSFLDLNLVSGLICSPLDALAIPHRASVFRSYGANLTDIGIRRRYGRFNILGCSLRNDRNEVSEQLLRARTFEVGCPQHRGQELWAIGADLAQDHLEAVANEQRSRRDLRRKLRVSLKNLLPYRCYEFMI